MSTLTRIHVVPHFMRLHEWIALDAGLYEEEGLEPDMLTDVMHDVSIHGADPYLERPQDQPFRQGLEVANSACEWGSVCNAGAGMGRFVPDLYGVARNAFFVRPDSSLNRLSDLAGVPVGVGIMAGSHFTALHALELVLPPERVKLENVGGPGRRLQALVDGEIEVANLLDPEIPIAHARGMRMIAAGEFRTLFWVSPGIPQAALDGYFRVLRKADEMLRSEPKRWLPLWERNVPPALAGDYDYSTFGLGELLVFDRYPQGTFDESVAFAKRWGLDRNMQETRYSALSVALS